MCRVGVVVNECDCVKECKCARKSCVAGLRHANKFEGEVETIGREAAGARIKSDSGNTGNSFQRTSLFLMIESRLTHSVIGPLRCLS